MTDPEMTQGKATTDVAGHDDFRDMVRLIQRIVYSEVSRHNSDDERATLRLDYQITVDVFKLLSDIRFRCLVFVTAIIAVANALLPNTVDAVNRISLGFVGFLTTLGITVYELRNSQLYEAAIHRAKILETHLKMERAAEQTHKDGPFGLFNERPPYVESAYWKGLDSEVRKTQSNAPLMTFWSVKVKHDQGLALIYGAVLGGWMYLIANGILSLPPPGGLWRSAPDGWIPIFAMVLAFATFFYSSKRFIYHDNKRFRPSAPNDPSAVTSVEEDE